MQLSVNSRDLSKNDLQTVLELINRCLHVQQKASITGILDTLKNIIPFDAAMLGLLQNKGEDTAVLSKVINNSFSEEWVSTYLKYNFIKADPIIARAIKDHEPFSWQEAYRSQATDNRHLEEFIETAFDFGLTVGIAYTRNVANSSEPCTLLSLSMCDRIESRYYHILMNILPHIHEAIHRMSIHCEPNKLKQSLTTREAEVLKWASEGKTAWEIGMILDISQRTVKFHLNNMYKKLDVINRWQAIAKAMRYGII